MMVVSSLLTLSAMAVAMPQGCAVQCDSHTVAFDDHGAVTALVTSAGVRMNARNPVGLFEVEVRKIDDFTEVRTISPEHARACAVERIEDGLALRFSGFDGNPVSSVECLVRRDGDRLRWRMNASPAAGWAVCRADYPVLALTPRIGADGADDTFVSGHTYKNGLLRNPGSYKWKREGRQPGWLGAQLACYCDPKALFLYCAEDGEGEAKSLTVENKDCESVRFRFAHLGWAVQREMPPYDVVTVCRDAVKGGEPLSWHDCADIYREWASSQRWCRQTYRNRRDLPAWLKRSPVHANLYDWRGWADRPGALEEWTEKFWVPNFPGSTLNLHFDGWERDGVYVMTDYFPVYPSNEAFAAHAAALARHDVLLFPWPSGYHRADAYDRGTNGAWRVDERAAFGRLFVPHACKNPDGTVFDRKYPWLKGGKVACMCGGDPWTIRWFSEDICARLAALGVPTVSGDQNIGGGFPACWDRSHPHPPGNGQWMTEAARRQAVDVMNTMRRTSPGTAAFSNEEANEQINDVVSYSYTREAYDPSVEWTGVFTYLYHEYLPIFASLGGVGRYSDAYCLAAGIMPRIKPKFTDYDPTAARERKTEGMASGNADPTAWWKNAGADDDEVRTSFLKRWIGLYSGKGREWLMFGRRLKPPRISCGTIEFAGRKVPAVFVGAFLSQDGRRALVFANGSARDESVSWRAGDCLRTIELPPYGAELVVLDD